MAAQRRQIHAAFGPSVFDAPSSAAPVQLVNASLTAVSAPALKTQTAIIKDQLNINAGDIDLPGTHVLGTIPRAEHVTAVVTEKGRVNERAESENMKKITGLARGEAKMVLGANIPAYYQAGHLIGDQLFGAETGVDTMAFHNLAPQYGGFNTPAYAQIMEAPVAALQKGLAAEVDMAVRLEYPGDTYRVSVADLIRRKVVSQYNVTAGGKNLQANDTLEFPSRIPKTWKLDVTVKDGRQLGTGVFSRGVGTAGQKHQPGLDVNTADAPGFGKGFAFVVQNAAETQLGLSVPESTTRSLAGVQWFPPRDGPRVVDILTSIENIFPELKEREELIEALQEEDHPLVGALIPMHREGGLPQPLSPPQHSVLDTLLDSGRMHLKHHLFNAALRLSLLEPNATEVDYLLRMLMNVHRAANVTIMSATSVLDLLERQFRAQESYFTVVTLLEMEIRDLRNRPLQGPSLPGPHDQLEYPDPDDNSDSGGGQDQQMSIVLTQ
jgi:hypothetical protein